MERHWPYLLVFALLMLAFPGPLMTVRDRLTKHRIKADEAVAMAFGEEARFIRTGALRPPYDAELRRLAVYSNRVVCGEIRTRDRWFAAAVLMPPRRQRNWAPIVYSVWTPKGFKTGDYSNPLPGKVLLERCAEEARRT